VEKVCSRTASQSLSLSIFLQLKHNTYHVL